MALEKTFSRLTDAERSAIVDRAERRSYKPGDRIIRQGQTLDGLFVVVQGQVRVERGFRVIREAVVVDKDGRQRRQRVPGRLNTEIARLGPGALFGEMSFVDREVTSASVSALSDVGALFISAAAVEELKAESPAFAGRFYHSLAIVLSRRLREANKRARSHRPARRADADADAPPRPEPPRVPLSGSMAPPRPAAGSK